MGWLQCAPPPPARSVVCTAGAFVACASRLSGNRGWRARVRISRQRISRVPRAGIQSALRVREAPLLECAPAGVRVRSPRVRALGLHGRRRAYRGPRGEFDACVKVCVCAACDQMRARARSVSTRGAITQVPTPRAQESDCATPVLAAAAEVCRASGCPASACGTATLGAASCGADEQVRHAALCACVRW